MNVDREAWLTGAAEIIIADLLGPAARVAGADPAPPVRVSVGWSRGARGGRALGSCHPRAMSADGRNELFIAPTIDVPAVALSTLVHELVHAADDCRDGHRGRFVAMARMVGFIPPWRMTTPGPVLSTYLDELAAALGPYPHARLDDSARRRQGTRMLPIECSTCGWRARTTASHLNPALREHRALCPGCGATTLGTR